MNRADLEAIVRDVVATSPDGELSEQHPGFQRLVARWAAEDSARTGETISPEAYFARGRAARREAITSDEKTDEVVAAVRRG
ncbi:hypothetical protein DZF92_04605 [Clavibacter michiganensis subsp. insidiosus]|uniref:Uncharacterized protein n=1 Tax=Clavibacter michiganensis subsp. insidiosus TaxID=33014 RepID=A0A399SME8_9MICO|nr:hypothetical protein [Clavibacter michiganensis]AWG01187.1 hypothetical protein BEH62_06205 [Clavibacter michiganensis subsp. insidiosus]OQJ60254.1 hypothetical protein B5P21_10285 [Clavibacter michiganensis subsp. insidiosus]RII88049.1 hypothetical protein DZF92_04605 [Clavibacter michiganensis subsp. insidiosus]RIJ43901.1 hypothetical protein DZF93_04835 [Clavibacter michiganensis subsp. insidiosus]RMC85600.1 hypothetical protein CmiCFBP2404_07260 [Clavibacter michiganensis subsp. insidio